MQQNTKNVCIRGTIVWIFITKGAIINVTKKVVDLLHYLETRQVCDDFTKRLDDDVSKARQNREWMVEYMKTLVHDMDVRNEGIEIGITQGIIQGLTQTIIEFLNEYGEVPESLKEKIYSEKDLEILKRWNNLSVKVASIAEFVEKM